MSDTITVADLELQLPNGLGPSAFGLPAGSVACPVSLSLQLNLHPSCVPTSVSSDTMSALSVNYFSVSQMVYHLLIDDRERLWTGPRELADAVAQAVLDTVQGVQSLCLTVALPKALLHAQAAIYTLSYSRSGLEDAKATIKGLKVPTVIGLLDHERLERQWLDFDLTAGLDNLFESWDHKAFADYAREYLERSSFGTLEALLHHFAHHLLKHGSTKPSQAVTVTVRKPSALAYALPIITITRTIADYPAPFSAADGSIQALIAVGSNIGDRLGYINNALSELNATDGIELGMVSRLYESLPMYVEDQDRFMNGCVMITTTLSALELVQNLKRIERSTGRTKTFTNGPRVIDLDLIFYGDEVVEIGKRGDTEGELGPGVGWLKVPHALVKEREFVLRPAVDIAPNYIHPEVHANLATLLRALPQCNPPALQPIIPFPSPSLPLTLTNPSSPHIMAIFNATPDSFSDGSEERLDVDKALEEIERILASPWPPAILDIGGMSTRPGSTPCSEEEEASRVVPLIQAIRVSGHTVPISVDTYRPNVARAAVEAGANCINDVRGGREDDMLAVMAELNVPVILMHSRGDSTTMTTPEMQDYKALGGIVAGVTQELSEVVDQALRAGVKRWNIIIDPGLGFAKSQGDQLLLLKHLGRIPAPGTVLEGLPMLVGASRKGFVGKVTGVTDAKARGYGDAAINAWSTQSGVVDILRVHDYEAASHTVKMLTAIRDAA